MRDLFVSYRREDTPGETRALYGDLTRTFGSDSVFMDVGGIAAGQDFRQVLEQKLSSCAVLLAVIGQRWSRPESQKDIDAKAAVDYVQLEIRTALKRGIPVIPVLVQGAAQLQPGELPEDLKDLAYRQHIRLTHEAWDSDVEKLIRELKPYVDPRPIRRVRIAMIAVLAVATIVVAWKLYRNFSSKAPPHIVALDKAAPAVTAPDTGEGQRSASSVPANSGDKSGRRAPDGRKATLSDVSSAPSSAGGNVSTWANQKSSNDAQEQSLRADVRRVLSGHGMKTSMTVNGETFAIGRKIPVPDWTWVTVLNEEPVSNANVTFKFNDSCGLDKGGNVEIRGFLADGNALFQYGPPTSTQVGTQCPAGVIFERSL